MKSILFRFLEKMADFSGRLGINRNTPGAVKLYEFLFGYFWPYKNVIEIQGSKMCVNAKDPNMQETFERYASNKIHEKSTTDLFKKTVRKGDTVVDLGANIGYFTLLAANLVGNTGKVYSFEPEPKNFSYLKKNVEINNYDYVEAFNKAVSNKNGKTSLFVCSYDTGHHTINQYNGIESYSRGRHTEKKSIEIDTVTLDSFLANKTRVDALKMDVEGAEMLALKGMDRIIKANPNIKMFIEFFPLLIEKMGDSPREFIRKILEDYKFSIFAIPDDYNASNVQLKKLNSIDEVMSFRKKEEDHINLFVKRS